MSRPEGITTKRCRLPATALCNEEVWMVLMAGNSPVSSRLHARVCAGVGV